MKKSSIIVDKDYIIGNVAKNLFGSFIEHMGRAVYEGIYEPDHPEADEDGFRMDVLELVKELSVPIVRYPGGNFVSSYKWTDGIGPKEHRPSKIELAWRTVEPNQVGIDDFMTWSKKVGTSVMAAVNLGTGTPEEAGQMLEYCNFEKGTFWSDLRIKNGYKDPHNIKVWCLGNEMDGPWQICRLTDEAYGLKALETAKIMRIIDPSVKLVACGSSTTALPSYPQWDRVVLEHCYDEVDYISLHHYFENHGNNEDFLASFITMDEFIHTVASVADYVKAKKRSKKRLMLSFDEWNIWYQSRPKKYSWQSPNPLIEDNYTMLDALAFSGLMCSLVNNCDRVEMACLAQLVNVIAPILTEKGGIAIRQTIFYPYKYFSQLAGGTALKTVVYCGDFEFKDGKAPLVYSSAVYNEENGSLTLFIVNNDLQDDSVVTLDLRSFDGGFMSMSHTVLKSDDLNATNTFREPFRVIPQTSELASVQTEISLPKASFNVIRFTRFI